MRLEVQWRAWRAEDWRGGSRFAEGDEGLGFAIPTNQGKRRRR